MFGSVFGVIVSGICALIMIIIGIAQLRSKDPVGFYSGVTPPDAKDLTDVKGWNRKHGIMWIIYGVIIMACWVLGTIIGNDMWALLIYCVGMIVPAFFMMAYHNKLIREYKVK